MDGWNYRKAVDLHREQVQDEVIHGHFRAYQKQEIRFVRDGGDALGVSRRAKELAPLYGIDYRTPVFAIHREGCYGGIVGFGYHDLKEYHQLVLQAIREGADFIKIMTTGIMDFANEGKITGTPLPAQEVKELVRIAHEEGMAVMSHTNGEYGAQAAICAGVDSLEHGNFMDEETIGMLADSDTVWVPTLVTVENLIGCGRFPDEALKRIRDKAAENLRLAYQKGAKAALGSDAGAHMVLHGTGLVNEYQAFTRILGDTPEVHAWLTAGEQEVRERFRGGRR